MANDAKKVIVGKPLATGGVLIAPSSAAVPVGFAAATGFTGVGYIGEDGVTQSIGADSSDIKAWGGDIVRKIQTTHDLTFQFVMIETNELSLKMYYGDDAVTIAEDMITVEITSQELGRQRIVLEIKDGDNRVRVVIPDGQVGERGDLVYQDESTLAYDVTITAYPDADGVKAYKYVELADAA